ncbi:MAG: glycerol-3-phosphate acyltransferase [Clostridia bacterium]|nr:glycerol-3-phosphate acyltransferase [Clostridia bacterium]
MIASLIYIVFSYLCGSILFARVAMLLFGKQHILADSKDNNPGTANAFMHGGFFPGVFTLLGDLLKGFLPVHLLIQYGPAEPSFLMLTLVLAAPVLGHAFPVFFHLEGGKGIATTFGCLLGLLPFWQPLLCFAFSFILLSTVIRISPHFQRTAAAYLLAITLMLFFSQPMPVILGFMLIALVVSVRLLMSKEHREKTQVYLLWFKILGEDEETHKIA